MGNTPSTANRPQGSSSASASASASPSPNHSHSNSRSVSRKDPRNLLHSQRTAASAAEASLAQAQAQARGTTTHRPRNSQSHPTNYFSQSPPNQSIDSPSVHSSDSQVATQQDDSKYNPIDLPSKPVDVPIPIHPDASSTKSYPESIEPSGPAPIQEMSYHLTRPPRLPLPIEEEVHTPGSPILSPYDEAPELDGGILDGDTIQRKTSALSNDTIEDEDAEELRVDRTKATVPTQFEWLQGGEKVYVTGTIFQWNKKHRLHPVYVPISY